MERVSQKMSALQLNLAPLKEPLGFIKVLQWKELAGQTEFSLWFSNSLAKKIFSIFAFATCGGYSGKTVLLLVCPNHNFSADANFAYPFRLNKVAIGPFNPEACNATWKEAVYLVGDFSSSAQFFVTFAVLVFLYCMAALVLYLGYMHLYRGAGKLPMLDFVITVVVAFLWLVSTSAWAKALTDIKRSTGPSMIDGMEPCVKEQRLCHFDEQRSLGSLNVSVVIGFLNLILWAGNAWFVYKETSLHQTPPTSPPNPADPGVPSGM